METNPIPPTALLAHWRAQGLHGDVNLGQAFERAATASADAPLVLCGEDGVKTHRLGALHDLGLKLAAALQQFGLRAGQTLAVQLPNSLEGVLLQRAAAALGLVYLPIVPIYAADELRHILADAGASALVLQARTRQGAAADLVQTLKSLPALQHVVVVGDALAGTLPWDQLRAEADCLPPCTRPSGVLPDAPALLVYTSGTTAVPKGVVHSANTLLAETQAASRHRSEALTPQLSPWPTGHIAGLVVLLQHALLGRPTVLMQRWDASMAVRLVESHGIVASSGTPFHLAALLDAADADGQPLKSLKDYLVGAASVPSDLVQRCAARGIATYRAYGLSEHPTVTMGRVTDPLDSRLHTEGSLMLGSELRFVDEQGQDLAPGLDGELACRGPERFLGYRDPALNRGAFLEGGWFLTGDIGHLDAGGYLHLTDRKKDIVNRGGEKMSSREIEEAMRALPQVLDVAVVAGPDPRVGERVCAFVVWREGQALSLADVAEHFARLGKARQKTPEVLVAVPELPRNATGKVTKQLLRDQLRLFPVVPASPS